MRNRIVGSVVPARRTFVLIGLIISMLFVFDFAHALHRNFKVYKKNSRGKIYRASRRHNTSYMRLRFVKMSGRYALVKDRRGRTYYVSSRAVTRSERRRARRPRRTAAPRQVSQRPSRNTGRKYVNAETDMPFDPFRDDPGYQTPANIKQKQQDPTVVTTIPTVGQGFKGAKTPNSRVRQFLSLRQGPGSGTHRMRKIPPGDLLQYHHTNKNGWHMVTHGNETGWVHPSYVRNATPDEVKRGNARGSGTIGNTTQIVDGVRNPFGKDAAGRTCVKRADLSVGKPRHWNKDNFIKFFLPLAVELQENTGFPAALSLYLVGLESGWGRGGSRNSRGDRLRRVHNVFHGVSCWTKGRKRDFSFPVTTRPEGVLTASGVCGPSRTKYENRKKWSGYYAFTHPYGSFISFMGLIKNGRAPWAKRVRAKLASYKARGKVPPTGEIAYAMKGYGKSDKGRGTFEKYARHLRSASVRLEQQYKTDYKLCPMNTETPPLPQQAEDDDNGSSVIDTFADF